MHSALRPIRRAATAVAGGVMQVPWKDIFSPNVLAALLAMVIGCVPLLKGLLVGQEAPLLLIYGTLDTLAGAAIPCMMLLLGATFSKGPTGTCLSSRTITAVCLVRLLVLPAVGVLLMLTLDRAGLLPGDPLFKFAMLLQSTVPSATMLQTMATMVGNGDKEMSVLLFWQYLFSIVAAPAWMVLYFWLLSG